jgi:hypothetical protein
MQCDMQVVTQVAEMVQSYGQCDSEGGHSGNGMCNAWQRGVKGGVKLGRAPTATRLKHVATARAGLALGRAPAATLPDAPA